MTPRRRWPDILILVGAAVVAYVGVAWADREFVRFEPKALDVNTHVVERPDWFWGLVYPYRRFQHDWIWVCVAATLGAGALLARDGWGRRSLSRPGANAVFVMLLVGGLTVAQRLLAWMPRFVAAQGTSHDLDEVLNAGLPGAIIGSWVVSWFGSRRRDPDWRERFARLVGWLWMVDVAMLIAYGLLFG
jgi:hypothetical protein